LSGSLSGGPGNCIRLYRWQTVLTFAFKHIVHSRALDSNRSG
jgi:hypothetical protein